MVVVVNVGAPNRCAHNIYVYMSMSMRPSPSVLCVYVCVCACECACVCVYDAVNSIYANLCDAEIEQALCRGGTNAADPSGTGTG